MAPMMINTIAQIGSPPPSEGGLLIGSRLGGCMVPGGVDGVPGGVGDVPGGVGDVPGGVGGVPGGGKGPSRVCKHQRM